VGSPALLRNPPDRRAFRSGGGAAGRWPGPRSEGRSEGQREPQPKKEHTMMFATVMAALAAAVVSTLNHLAAR